MVAAPESDDMSIGELAARSGVSDGTLRAWERRYGLLRPHRTPGGHRRYGHADLVRVLRMVRLQREGLSAGVAAARIVNGDEQDEEAVPSRSGPDLQRRRRRLHVAAERLDTAAVLDVLTDAQHQVPAAVLLDEVVVPLLHHLGEGWRRNARHVAREHATSAAIRTWLVSRLWRDADPAGVPTVVACPDGEYHDLGALMASLVLAETGWRPVVLGASTPWMSTSTVIEELRPPLVLVGTISRPAALHLLERWQPPQPTTAVFGGPALSAEDVAGHDGVWVHTGSYGELPRRVDEALATQAATG